MNGVEPSVISDTRIK